MSEKASGSSIRVMVVDDHELFRQGVSSILSRIDDVEVVAEAENGRVAVQRAREYHPDVVLMDINMPVCDGLRATRQIKAEHPDIQILILTVTDTEEMLFEAIKSGASGYVLKKLYASVAHRQCATGERRGTCHSRKLGHAHHH